MAYLDLNESFTNFRDRTLDGIKSAFPMKGKLQTLELEKLEVRDNLDHDDIKKQYEARMGGHSFAVPVYGHLILKDNATGKTVDKRSVRLAEIPKITQRYSYIVDGQEYQVDNQWQLKPGAYTRRRNNGELETRFNVVGKKAFDLMFDDKSKKFVMEYGTTKRPLYPFLQAMGVSDDALKKSWGEEVFAANKDARGNAGSIAAFYKSDTKKEPASHEEAKAHFLKAMEESKLRPDSTSITLGKPFSNVTGDALHIATQNLLRMQKGHPPDDRDSLVFKDLRSAGDYVVDMFRSNKRAVEAKVNRKINTATDIRDVIKFDTLNVPVVAAFKKNPASNPAKQINPLEMVSASLQTTIMGVGGIQSADQVSNDAKMVNPSHLGFLDPLVTPEGARTGVSLRLPIGVRKEGNTPKINLYNLKTKKTEYVDASTALHSNVVMADQVTWKDGHPVPTSSKIKVATGNNHIREMGIHQADYAMLSPTLSFNLTSNMLPFLGNTSGNRASMATRHIEQAISLNNREAPLIQVGTGNEHPDRDSFERVVGMQSAHTAPVAGTITKLTPTEMQVTAADKTQHKVHLYNHYPVNDAKSVLHSTPVVKLGDKVAAGQLLADNNYTKNGTMALGKNLRVGFLPFKGYNFEDGVVISQAASAKMASEHLHKHVVPVDEEMTFSKKRFHILRPGVYKTAQTEHIGEDGIAKVGSRVKPGDPLVLATQPYSIQEKAGLGAIKKAMSGEVADKSLRWSGHTEGEVVGVEKGKDGIHVHVRTLENMNVGDKICGRYGNKGIIGLIVPDHQMPHTKDGKPIDVALNPFGIPGRMNVGQVLETALSKVAEKTGKTIKVENFHHSNDDAITHVQAELKKHGLSDTEELFDPNTKMSLGKVMVGNQYMLKLVHQADKKVGVSSGMTLPGTPVTDTYDLNKQPTNGQRLGALGVYALLAHGAVHNLRESQTLLSEGESRPDPYKPSQHQQVWTAIQTGGAIPTPKPSFAFEKFTDMLKGAGVNVEKKGHEIVASPLTHAQILKLTENRVIHKPGLLESSVDKETGELKPQAGGLFDKQLTGGHGGKLWSRVNLAEPVANPIFEKPIRSILGLKEADYANIVHGVVGVTPHGVLSEHTPTTLTGGAAIEHMLSKIDVEKELAAEKKKLDAARPAKIDEHLKKVKYLNALHSMGMKADEAYILKAVPIIPPAARPASLMHDGNVSYADINKLYKSFGEVNVKLADPVLKKSLTDNLKTDLRKDLYDNVRAIVGYGVPYDQQPDKGILHQIAGSSPKSGLFQKVLMQKRRELSMRSVITPEPALGLDELSLPQDHALDLFRPFVVKKLVDMGAAQNPLDAQKLLATRKPITFQALEAVTKEHPVLFKRDPALHKYSVQGFNVKLHKGDDIKIHPLVCGGFNSDFDGDTMSVFVPVTKEAIEEAHRMKPTNNLFSDSTGQVMYKPSLEAALGLYKMSLRGKDTSHVFKNAAEVVEAGRAKKIGHTDVVSLNGKKTTLGRVMLAAAVPESMQHDMLHNIDDPIHSKGLDKLFVSLAHDHKSSFDRSANNLKDLGNSSTYGTAVLPLKDNVVTAIKDPSKLILVPTGAHTLSLDDFKTDKVTRDKILKVAHADVDKYNKGNSNQLAQDVHAIKVYGEADKQMRAAHELAHKDHPDNLYTMYAAGVKPSWSQYKQMKLAPMLLADSLNRVIPTPVTKSYSEGLDMSGYWTQMHGARRGTVMKVQEVQEPGYLSKLLQQNTMDMTIQEHDCKTPNGVLLPVGENDIHDRHLARETKLGALHLKAGTLLTPTVVTQLRAADKDAKVLVRSPLKCDLPKGLCQVCHGLNSDGHHHAIGANVGVLASHAIGERAVQLTLKEFHTGGVAGAASSATSAFGRFQQLTNLDKKIPNSASLAMRSGTIDEIHPTATGANIVIGGVAHHVGRDTLGNELYKHVPGAPSTGWVAPHVGQTVKAGASLSDPLRTIVNPHDLYAATKSVEAVQNHLSGEIYGLYKNDGVKRRHVETLVRGMTNLTQVTHAGDGDVLRGDTLPLSSVRTQNEHLSKGGKAQIEHTPIIQGITLNPLESSDWLAKLQHQKIRTSIADAASLGHRSNIHGSHPIPGLAYGAEFGLNATNALKPGLGHLADVKKHNY